MATAPINGLRGQAIRRRQLDSQRLPFIHELRSVAFQAVDVRLLCNPHPHGNKHPLRLVLDGLRITHPEDQFTHTDQVAERVTVWIDSMSKKPPWSMHRRDEILAYLSHLPLTDHLLLQDLLVELYRMKYTSKILISGIRKLTRWTLTLPTSMIRLDVNQKAGGKEAFKPGGFCDLYRDRLGNNVEVGIKVNKLFETTSLKDWRIAFGEVLAWKQVSENKRILPLLGVSVTYFRGRLSLVSPWCIHGHIREYLSRYQQVDRMSYIVDITKGIEFLHSKSYIHGDIKAANILINDRGQVQIADMGLTSASLSVRLNSTIENVSGGTIPWMAPELLALIGSDMSNYQQQAYTYATDVYSWAVTVYEIITLQEPYRGLAWAPLIGQVVNGRRPQAPRENKYFFKNNQPMVLWGLVEWGWKQERSQRPRMKDLLGYLLPFAGNTSKRRGVDQEESMPKSAKRARR